MHTRRARAGLTLVEILLSMLVFIIGIVGILALFPTAMATSQRSIAEQRASILAESVKNSLSQAMRTIKDPQGNAAPPFTPNYVIFTHDFKRVDSAGTTIDSQIYGENNELPLPGYLGSGYYTVEGVRRHPGNVAPATTPEVWNDPDVFIMMGDGWMQASHDAVVNSLAPDEDYHAWSYAFDVSKAETMPWITNLQQRDARVRLWEFTIYIFQRRPNVTASGSGTGSSSSTTWENRMVLRVSDRIALK
jgi:type II secretory pathway pseudopilin PulG